MIGDESDPVTQSFIRAFEQGLQKLGGRMAAMSGSSTAGLPPALLSAVANLLGLTVAFAYSASAPV
jgi:hypothetical protein